MTWRTRITPNAMVDGIDIQLARRLADGRAQRVRFMKADDEITDEGTNLTLAVPSLTIDDELGRALMDALVAFYGGTSAGQQLRADFEHERRRVDRMLNHLMREGGAA